MTNEKIIGYCEKKWRLNEFAAILNECEDTFEAYTTDNGIKDSDSLKLVILQIIRKSIITARGVIVLCQNGLSDDAFALSRNLFEQFIIICFFANHLHDDNFIEILEDYIHDAQIQECRLQHFLGQHFFPEESDYIKEQQEELYKQCHYRPEKDKFKEYWWSRKDNFSCIVDDVCKCDEQVNELIRQLHWYYKLSCVYLHANSFGNADCLGSKYESNVIDLSPDISGQKIPLHFSSMTLIGIIGQSSLLFGIDNSSLKIKLNELAKYYNQQPDKFS